MRLSRSLLKLIDEAIIPALIVFGAKLVGLAVANYWYHLTWDVGTGHVLFPLLSYRSPEAFAMANGFSNAVVMAVILVGFLWVLIRAYKFHTTHISPRLSVSLVQMEMTGLAVSSWEIYHQAVIWMAYLWLGVIVMVVEAMSGISPWWLVIASGLVGVMFSWFFIADVEREVELTEERHAS